MPPQGRPRVDPGPRAGRLGGEGHRPHAPCWMPSSATSRHPRRRAPTPRRTRPARTSPSPRPTDGPLLVRVFKTAADPVRRAAHLPARAVGDAQEPGRRVQRHEGRGRAHRPAAVPATARSRSRRPSFARARSARSRSSASPRPATRSGRATTPCACRTIAFPNPMLQVAIDPAVQGRPGQDGPGAAADARGGADRTRRAQRDRRADPAGDRRGPRGRHLRPAEAQVRRRHRHPDAHGPVSRDHPRHHQVPRPLQEADRRPRDVRRCLDRA